jgi:hypothetical protein
MRLWATRVYVSHLVAAIILTTAGAAAAQGSSATAAQGSLATARDLYSAASYDDALAMLNGLHVSDHRSNDGRAIDQYRALCLLALGRTDEATTAIQAIVTEVPSYHLTEADVSPRVRAAFRDVRRLMLPGIIQQKYADAKVAFDRKNLAAASEGFKLVLELLGDSDLGSAANQPPLSQLRPLASGFLDLTAAAATPSVAPSAPLLIARRSVPPPVAVSAPAPTPSPRPAAPRIYGWEDANVVGPIVLRQTMPVLGDVFAQRQGTVEVIINEAGLVETAMMTSPVNAVYDGLVLAAARSWRYKPATIDGVAVKFRHAIQLDLKRR